MESQRGAELVRELARDCDVFITNLTQPRLERYGLTDKDIHAVNPRAVYGVLSGYGTQGADSDRQAFDQTAFWARSGAMSVFGERSDGPVLSRGGYGDRTTGLNLLASILAALRLAEKTGQGQYVEVTLQRTGIWALASDMASALYERVQPEKTSRTEPPNPIWNWYLTADDRWIALVMPMALPYWEKFCQLVERPDWQTDERFESLLGMIEHGPSVVPEIDALFRQHTLDEWRPRLDASGLIWEPVALLPEVIEDPALRERGAFSMIVHHEAGAMEVVSAPFHIRDADISVRGPAPDAGQHTREVFTDLGLKGEEIEQLIETGVLS